MTRPSTLRAARPMVWISERLASAGSPPCRRRGSRPASTSGRSSPSRSRLMPTSTSNCPEPQVAEDLDPLQRVDVGVQVAHPDARLVQVLGQVLGHPLGQRGDQRRARPWPPPCRISSSRSSTWAATGRISIGGIDQAGRADHLLDEDAAGLLQLPGRRAWPRRRPICGRIASHSSNFSGRLSMRRAGGSRARPGSPCARSRRGTCRRSAAP